MSPFDSSVSVVFSWRVAGYSLPHELIIRIMFFFSFLVATVLQFPIHFDSLPPSSFFLLVRKASYCTVLPLIYPLNLREAALKSLSMQQHYALSNCSYVPRCWTEWPAALVGEARSSLRVMIMHSVGLIERRARHVPHRQPHVIISVCQASLWLSATCLGCVLLPLEGG